MQRQQQNSNHSHTQFQGGSMFPTLFGGGGRDPFDDPFFSRPFGTFFTPTPHASSAIFQQTTNSKQPVIEELLSDDEGIPAGEEGDHLNHTAWANRNPLVEHPDDQEHTDHGNNDRENKELLHRTDRERVQVANPQTKSVSFKRVSYGGIDGTYYTATTTRRTGDDGVTLEESRQADKTTGQATHRISRGIQDKGHSVTRKLDADGKVDTMQTLHNLDEDDLVGFEQAWKGKSDMRSHSLDNMDDFSGASGSGSRSGGPVGWGYPFRDEFGRIGRQADARRQAESRAKPKEIRINIE